MNCFVTTKTAKGKLWLGISILVSISAVWTCTLFSWGRITETIHDLIITEMKFPSISSTKNVKKTKDNKIRRLKLYGARLSCEDVPVRHCLEDTW